MTIRSLLVLFLLLLACSVRAQEWIPAPGQSDTLGCARKASALLANKNVSTRTSLPEIDALYYKLDLRLIPELSLLSGRVVMRARVSGDSLPAIVLDLSSPMILDSVRIKGALVPVTRYPQAFAVGFSTPLRRGDIVELETFYHGTPMASGFGSFVFSATSGSPWIWSLSQPYGARDWWPCNDQLSDKADSVDIWVTCPATLKVGSNGRLVEVQNNVDGTRTHKWAERYPIAAYLVSIAVGPYVEFSNWYRYSPNDSMQVLNYVMPGRLQEALTTLPKTPDMLQIFSSLFGSYPFLREKYGHSEFGRGGAMEHQTMTSTITFDEDVISHELAHQWFGDLITCTSWQHLWLNEGFATYSEALYREARYGVSEYRRLMEARMSSALNAEGTLFVQDTSTVASLFSVSRVYAKGASVLHMLRHVLGDSLFFQSLRAYVAQPRLRYATATTEDFRQTCEATSGKDLSWFFSQWVYGERYPRYIVGWSNTVENAKSHVTIRIQQQTLTANPSFFVMPVDCRISSTTADTTVVLMNNLLYQEFVIPVGFVPTRVEIDPDRWILRDILDASAPLPEAFVLEPNYPNPFNPSTTVTVKIPRRASVALAIYSLMGERIRTLADGRLEPGSHSFDWTGVSESGRPVASGVYFCRLTADGYVATQRMLLLR